MTQETERVMLAIPLENVDELLGLFGVFDENIGVLEDETGAHISAEEHGIRITGEQEGANIARIVIEKMLDMQRRGEKINRSRIRYAVDLAKEGNADMIEKIMGDVIAITNKGRQIKCKTLGQKRYVQALKEFELVFGIGPAGTGKTYLAVAMAVQAFKNKEVDRIILTRPAVEAGEKLGFLPGDLQNKVDPYLRPLYDALFDMLGAENFQKYVERQQIEVAPLAYMRGRTLDDSFIILDEAQNTTPEQMKMFLTRIGFGSKCVVTGDVSQIDLPKGATSGLIDAERVLKRVKGLAFTHFTSADVVRHPLVARIVDAYDAQGRPAARAAR